MKSTHVHGWQVNSHKHCPVAQTRPGFSAGASSGSSPRASGSAPSRACGRVRGAGGGVWEGGMVDGTEMHVDPAAPDDGIRTHLSTRPFLPFRLLAFCRTRERQYFFSVGVLRPVATGPWPAAPAPRKASQTCAAPDGEGAGRSGFWRVPACTACMSRRSLINGGP